MIGPLTLGWIGRLAASLAAILATCRYGFGLYAWRAAEILEQPNYTVIRKLSDGVELRKYEPYLIAETTTSTNSFSEAGKDGFRACAGYIFGKNKPQEKMAMTAPVRISGKGSGDDSGEKMAMTSPVRIFGGGKKKSKVSFVIGSKYSLSSAPRPVNKNVSVKQVSGHYLAAKKFSGPPPTDQRVKQEKEKIIAALKVADLKAKSGEETLVYGYHDPFITPNILRKNEVAVLVDGSKL